ncbi:hypothetical protein [Candidatus Nitrosocosmicus sp. FF01]
MVVGSTGKSKLDRMLVGSVAEGVVTEMQNVCLTSKIIFSILKLS